MDDRESRSGADVIERRGKRKASRRRRLLLYVVGGGILLSSGALVTSGIQGLIAVGIRRWIQVAPNFALGIFGLLVTVLLFYAVRRENQMLEFLDWFSRLDNILAGLKAPLTRETLFPACQELAGLFPHNSGWIVLVKAPGLLIRGEVKRRRYLPVVSEGSMGTWNVSWAENYLKDRMEEEGGRRDISTVLPGEGGRDHTLACWVSQNRAGDITTGMAIAFQKNKWRRDSLTTQAMATGVDMVVGRIGSILTEVIQRREGLGVENLGLIMRILAHEINNDLQGALNTIEAIGDRASNMTDERVLYLRSLLARSAHWSHLMREAPFLVDKVLPFERNVVSLTKHLRVTMEEVRRAWPDVSFAVNRTDDEDDIRVVGDQHLRSILRNLIHNAASYTPEEGSVEIRIILDGESAHVIVKDDGPGVDPADMDMIFAPLESMREGRRVGERVDYGMGVGLTISRAIARAYGGELLCHSNLEEAGGVFEVILPMAEIGQGEGEEVS
ncbi:MAG: sensor histidine kinase [Anaerolineales bacterium]|nr:MAG: sensor histidine kinase [Anaerolineales bacterium]